MENDKLQLEFSKIYDQYIQSIYRFAYIKVNSQYQAEEICSDVFTKYWNTIKQGAKIENARAFLYQSARNAVIDLYRKKGRDRIVPLENCAEPAVRAEFADLAVSFSDMEQIKKALLLLDEESQNAVIFYYLDDMKANEIAKILGKSEGAVRTMISRALKDIKTQLV